MVAQSLKNIEMIGKKLARALDATILPVKDGFIVEKRNKNKNTYIRIQFVRNIVTEQTDLAIEKGTLSDKKPDVKEIIKDIENLCMTIPDGTEDTSKNVVTFLYTHGDRFSIVNMDTGMVVSRICAFDRRKLLEGKKVPKEIMDKRRQFTKIF